MEYLNHMIVMQLNQGCILQ